MTPCLRTTHSLNVVQHLKKPPNYETSYTVDEFYKKVELDRGTLDEDGDEIEYIYVKTELDNGDYKIDLTDGDGDLYEVKDTNIFIKFNGYFGYAGYSTECILKVEYYSSTVYKLE